MSCCVLVDGSIGSLGNSLEEDGVQNVTVKTVVFNATDNGLRIKTWARDSNGFVKDVVFEDVIMKNVKNPIIIDQNYCPGRTGCPKQTSGIKISNVKYMNVRGSSATPVAVKLDCSASKPCTDMGLHDINLKYQNRPAKAYCKNARGTSSGIAIPSGCF
ncbi:hypothetical protein Taro_036155 [Colocasia esculenta]|uniref:Polygalacturonase n=1 Tax=Colocasia esculenta TaxID=4460 RepID=A0A843WGZ7_COLES|nr:hypothetical protein [Colocasia esculenta]